LESFLSLFAAVETIPAAARVGLVSVTQERQNNVRRWSEDIVLHS